MYRLIKYTFLLFSALIIMTNCSQSVSDDSTQAPTEAIDPSSLDKMIEIDSVNSVVTWIGSRPGKKHDGTIEIKNGNIGFKNDQITSGEIIIDVSTIEVKDIPVENEDHAILTHHLLSEDFFDADSFPTVTFIMTDFMLFDSTLVLENQSEKELLGEMVIDPTHIITGGLSIRGINRQISFPARITKQQDRLLLEARFDVDRQNWGIGSNAQSSLTDKAMDQLIFDTLNLGIYILTTSVSN